LIVALKFLFLPRPLTLAFNFAAHWQQLFLTCHLRHDCLSHCIAEILLELLVALDCLHLTEKHICPRAFAVMATAVAGTSTTARQ